MCKLYGQLDYETALNHVDVEHLKMMKERLMDKKVGEISTTPATIFMKPARLSQRNQHIVRVEAFAALGQLYRLAYPEMYVSACKTSSI